jgi:hypothetical protein
MSRGHGVNRAEPWTTARDRRRTSTGADAVERMRWSGCGGHRARLPTGLLGPTTRLARRTTQQSLQPRRLPQCLRTLPPADDRFVSQLLARTPIADRHLLASKRHVAETDPRLPMHTRQPRDGLLTARDSPSRPPPEGRPLRHNPLRPQQFRHPPAKLHIVIILEPRAQRAERSRSRTCPGRSWAQ